MIPCQKECRGFVSNGKPGKQIFHEGDVYACPKCGTEYRIELGGVDWDIPLLKTTGVVRPVTKKANKASPAMLAALDEAKAMREKARAAKDPTIRRLREDDWSLDAIAKEVRLTKYTVRESLERMGMSTKKHGVTA